MPDAYIICGTPRSGSTLLCDLLADSGAGRPASYFRRQSIARIAAELAVGLMPGQDGFERAYLDAMLEAGRGGGQLFGLRLMRENAPELMAMLDRLYPGRLTDAARLGAAFGSVRYIHLSRGDKVAQAVSLLKAARTGLWHKGADGSDRERYDAEGEAVYDPRQMDDTVAELDSYDAAWRAWFAAENIVPFSIVYERFAADPIGVMGQLLAFLELDPATAAGLAPRTARLADAQSADWIARFRAQESEG